MLPDPKPRVVSAERLNGSLVITFDDGRFALYPGSLLYDMLAEAGEFAVSSFEEQTDGEGES